MKLWSSAFLDGAGAAEWATCAVSIGEWRRLMDEHDGATRLFARVSVGDHIFFAALGAPVANTGAAEPPSRLYMPYWMLTQMGVEGVGEDADVEWLPEEAFPESTRIVLRPHDSAFYCADAKEELESGLTRLGVIRVGDTVTVPLECLGGFIVSFDVVTTEPANVVLAQGDEVAIEFEEALDRLGCSSEEPVVARPPTPIPPSITPFLPEHEFDTMISSLTGVAPVAPVGQRLGGEERFMPDGTRWNPWRHGPWRGP